MLSQAAKNLLEKNFEQGMNLVRQAIRDELEQQGHRASGKGIEDMQIEVKLGANEIVGNVYMRDYIVILDRGVKPSRVPYSPTPRGRGGTSKFIEALIRWAGFVKSGLNLQERKSFAFAVAAKAKKEGFPTRGSYAYSKNGRRKDWVKAVEKEILPNISDIMQIDSFLQFILDEAVKAANKKN